MRICSAQLLFSFQTKSLPPFYLQLSVVPLLLFLIAQILVRLSWLKDRHLQGLLVVVDVAIAILIAEEEKGDGDNDGGAHQVRDHASREAGS